MGGSYLVRFKGGPYGGEELTISKAEFVGSRLRVPVMTSLQSVTGYRPESLTPPAPSVSYGWEEYQLEYRLDGIDHWQARWINPNEGLRRDNAKLRERITELERAKEALEAIDTLRTFFNNGF